MFFIEKHILSIGQGSEDGHREFPYVRLRGIIYENFQQKRVLQNIAHSWPVLLGSLFWCYFLLGAWLVLSAK